MSLTLNGKDSITGQFRHARSNELFLNYASYTPTGTWTTNTTWEGSYRIIGDTLDSQISITLSGIPTVTNSDGSLKISLPPGFLIDTTKMPNSSRIPIGNATLFDNLGNWYVATVVWQTSLGNDDVEIVYHAISGSFVSISAVTDAAPFVWNSGDKIDIYYSIPVA